MVLNRQHRVALNLAAIRSFVKRLRAALRLGRRSFNVCLVHDREIQQLQRVYRGIHSPTDVLSFPWKATVLQGHTRRESDEFRNFLGDVMISAETAKRNARSERHSTTREVQWLVLHGVLHLLGHDHTRDTGQMTRLEYSVRQRLGIAGSDESSQRRGRKGSRRPVPYA